MLSYRKTVTANMTREIKVLLIEDNFPSLKWLIGRVEAVHLGTDGVVSVVTREKCKG